MTLLLKETENGQEHVLDDGTTIEHVLCALNWIKKEKARQAGKYQRYVKPKREALREALQEVSPPPEPTPDPPAKRPRGRPRKYPVGI